MARKILTLTIEHEGRDKGKVFQLRELPASQAEKWALRAFLAIARSGVELPENITEMGMAGIAVTGIKALGSMSFADAEPLLDEMFTCIQIQPDPTRPAVIRGLIEDDIEEVFTRTFLRKEVIMLHINFSTAANQSM